MGTWKNPERLVWHDVVCSRCNRVINRVKLPGLIRSRSERLCAQCAAGGAGPSRRGGGGGAPGAGADGARAPRERRPRTPRRTQETTPASS